jgi:type IV pilus assembly protein PilW
MRGFSMVELMVSITIGLIIMSAVSTMFVSTKRTYNEQDRQAKMQENARFALHFLMRDLRLAGYYGCVDDINPETIGNSLNTTADGSAFKLNATYPIEGLEDGAGRWYPSGITALPTGINAGTDAIILRFADVSSDIELDKAMPNTSGVLKITSTGTIVDGDIIMISDCASADVLQITGVHTEPHFGHNTGDNSPGPGNVRKELSKPYTPPAKIMKFIARTYYIRNNASGIPSLYRQDNNEDAQELVEGVESMHVTYGIDTDGDDIANQYAIAGAAGVLTTADQWANVRSVRLGLLVRTVAEDSPHEDIKRDAWEVNGEPFVLVGADRNRRRLFHVTVQLRNLL